MRAILGIAKAYCVLGFVAGGVLIVACLLGLVAMGLFQGLALITGWDTSVLTHPLPDPVMGVGTILFTLFVSGAIVFIVMMGWFE